MAVISDHCPNIMITLVDVDKAKIDAWNNKDLSKLPIFEPGLKEIVARNRDKTYFFLVILKSLSRNQI